MPGFLACPVPRMLEMAARDGEMASRIGEMEAWTPDRRPLQVGDDSSNGGDGGPD
jgi:hypothetical protein